MIYLRVFAVLWAAATVGMALIDAAAEIVIAHFEYRRYRRAMIEAGK